MKDLRKLIGLFVIIAIFSRGFFEPILKGFTWLIMQNYTPSSISFLGDIIVRIATFVISFALVGTVFSRLSWFDRGIMKVAYFVVSTLVTCLLSWLVMIFETNIVTISIIIGMLFVSAGIYWGVQWYNKGKAISTIPGDDEKQEYRTRHLH